MSADGIDRELEGRPANPDFPGKLGISPSDKIGPKFNTPKKVTKKEIKKDISFFKNQRESKVTKKFSDIAKDAEKSSMKKIKLGGIIKSKKKK